MAPAVSSATRSVRDAAAPSLGHRAARWSSATWSQVRLSQRVFWQDVAFALIGALMPIAMGLAPAWSYRHQPAPAGGVPVSTYLLPGGMAAALLWIIYTTVNSAARRRETKVYKRLRATPLSDSSILVGETVSACLPAVLQSGVVLATGVLALGVPLPRHPALLVVGVLLAAACYGLLAMGLSGLLPSGEVATWIVTPFVFGLWYVSGAITPLDAFPGWLADVSHLLPATATADVVRAAFLGVGHTSPSLTQHFATGAATWAVLRPLLVLLAWSALGALLWKRFFRWDPRRSR
ncbi:ABC transporter permease [Kineococcus siccus]|uniref:ABC transporter permease n=1 Tax=Kineococcus siccus TaxID=2696567 RepID=UPI001F0D4E30|nr:ABC transporter permease [Kineococcus siccus]